MDITITDVRIEKHGRVFVGDVEYISCKELSYDVRGKRIKELEGEIVKEKEWSEKRAAGLTKTIRKLEEELKVDKRRWSSVYGFAEDMQLTGVYCMPEATHPPWFCVIDGEIWSGSCFRTREEAECCLRERLKDRWANVSIIRSEEEKLRKQVHKLHRDANVKCVHELEGKNDALVGVTGRLRKQVKELEKECAAWKSAKKDKDRIKELEEAANSAWDRGIQEGIKRHAEATIPANERFRNRIEELEKERDEWKDGTRNVAEEIYEKLRDRIKELKAANWKTDKLHRKKADSLRNHIKDLDGKLSCAMRERNTWRSAAEEDRDRIKKELEKRHWKEADGAMVYNDTLYVPKVCVAMLEEDIEKLDGEAIKLRGRVNTLTRERSELEETLKDYRRKHADPNQPRIINALKIEGLYYANGMWGWRHTPPSSVCGCSCSINGAVPKREEARKAYEKQSGRHGLNGDSFFKQEYCVSKPVVLVRKGQELDDYNDFYVCDAKGKGIEDASGEPVWVCNTFDLEAVAKKHWGLDIEVRVWEEPKKECVKEETQHEWIYGIWPVSRGEYHASKCGRSSKGNRRDTPEACLKNILDCKYVMCESPEITGVPLFGVRRFDSLVDNFLCRGMRCKDCEFFDSKRNSGSGCSRIPTYAAFTNGKRIKYAFAATPERCVEIVLNQLHPTGTLDDLEIVK